MRYAIKAGLAVHGKIAEIAKMDRKNYCYPDLAKAYQISQLYAPLIIGGYIELSNGRRIRLHHIHIEEDAGKLIHRHGDTYVDYNRGGVPLIEIVSEPDIRSIDEAKEYVERLQQVEHLRPSAGQRGVRHAHRDQEHELHHQHRPCDGIRI